MKKRSFTFRDFQTIFALISLGIVFAAGLIAFNWWLADQYGTGAEILPAWHGARAFLFEDLDPYSRTVAERTQVGVYGRIATETESPYALDIPFPLLILFFPLALVPDPVWARAVWMFLSEIGLLVLVTLAFQLADWQPRRGFALFALAFALLWYYSVLALFNGSLSILLILALVGALLSLRSFNDEGAGVLLAVASMHWDITLVLWFFIVIGVFVARRWRVFFGFLMTWVVLGGVSLLIYPNWLWPSFLRAVAANSRANDLLSPAWFLGVWFPQFGTLLARGGAVLLGIILAFELAGTTRSDNFRRVAWVAALSLAATPLFGFSTNLHDLAPLVFSFAFILPFAWERWAKRPYLVLVIICLIFFAFPLILRWQLTAAPFVADGLIFLLLPLLTIIGLYWIRWYVVRPPRTWLDQVKRELRK